MSSEPELDDKTWALFEDSDKSIEAAAKDALDRIGWQETIEWTRLALNRGVIDGRCVQIWCVKLRTAAHEVRHCMSGYDADPRAEIVRKFAATFAALREA